MHDLLVSGIAPDAAQAILRVGVGAFFAVSGYHKLTNKARHATLVETLKADHVPAVRWNQWFVPAVEFTAGIALTLGLLTILAALLLGAICLVATCVDGLGRIKEWSPIDRADWLDDLLYLPEVLYGLALVAVILGGSGRYSLDALLLAV